jgi:hypothetical protein
MSYDIDLNIHPEEIYEERVDPSLYMEASRDDILDNLHEDEAFRVFIDDYQRNNEIEDFESLVDGVM